ncbi:glutamate racemase [Myxococcus stipitatus DSM 14675]|uniref:Glutamate racemase n=1 Tax=Myxococcus stipitatus (strain DSM 14675 / JCM 12634 / Mx s8) TaxID=1278073 RepID=L7UFA4_MYXSD|nr:glutamate racemase [Myxococcus stipitatus]AGC47611.1 glutamate racemase [Myxococcus stipitatus DSM 14675]
MRQASHSPIGVFDSGVGGLTVLKSLMEHLPHESTVYLGDTARVPYGTKSGEVVTRYSLKNAEFLLERGIKLLVVACNTASSVALPALEAALPVPVVGVIGPGAQAALARTQGGGVGVIGTQGTIRSGAYQRALEAQDPRVRVKARACPLFVPLAEEGWTTGDVPMLTAREYLGEFARDGVDTLVLGCTHYPLLKGVIQEVVGPRVALVDSAEATAQAVVTLLEGLDLLAPATSTPSHAYFVTDVPERFTEVGARFLGRPIASAEQVDLKF